jgi:phospholipase C
VKDMSGAAALQRIEHVVVLMLENRSFDNLFGFYRPPSGAPCDGLTGREFNLDAAGRPWPASSASLGARTLWAPDPDPGEQFVDMNTQIYGNAAAAGAASMNGFVRNYAAQPAPGLPAQIMHAFAPGDAPALHALADAYALCDAWHASAPCQTWPNRFFLHTGTANGYENNLPLHFPYEMPTIFKRLEGHLANGWRVYFHDVPQALILSDLWDRFDRFSVFDDFLADAAAGQLPTYAFLEPRYFADADWPNDMHPPHNVAYGDRLVAQTYAAVRASPCWPSTLLIVVFDEHGGCYDHVAPGAAPPPEAPRPGQAFAFDRYGVRVPALLVSPFVRPGTVFRSGAVRPFDHASIIATLRARFGIATSLTQRDAGAPDLGAVLALGAPANNGPLTVPSAPRPAADDDEALEQARLAPLNDFQAALHKAVGFLAPMIHGVAAADHIANLRRGYVPSQEPADNSIDALGDIKNLVGKLLG